MPDNFDFLVTNPAELTGTLTADTVDVDGVPNKVLDNNLTNTIQVNWQLGGTLFASGALSGSWQLQAFFERIGGGFEFSLPGTPMTIAWNSTGVYSATIPIPPGTAAIAAYKIVVLLSHLNSASVPTRMTGFVELPMVRFY